MVFFFFATFCILFGWLLVMRYHEDGLLSRRVEVQKVSKALCASLPCSLTTSWSHRHCQGDITEHITKVDRNKSRQFMNLWKYHNWQWYVQNYDNGHDFWIVHHISGQHSEIMSSDLSVALFFGLNVRFRVPTKRCRPRRSRLIQGNCRSSIVNHRKGGVQNVGDAFALIWWPCGSSWTSQARFVSNKSCSNHSNPNPQKIVQCPLNGSQNVMSSPMR